MALEPLRKESPEATTAPALDQRVSEPTTTHAAPAVDADRLFVGRTFELQPLGASSKDPDEAPLKWSNERSAPPTPWVPIDCTATGDPPARLPQPKAAPRVEPCHNGHHRRDDRFSESEAPDFSEHRRGRYWAAFKSVSAQAQARHGGMGDDLQAFREAHGDTGLAALDYRLPTATWKGNLADLTDKQKVPEEDGATVGSLFDGDNLLRLDKHDQHAIDGAGTALKKGKGTIQKNMLRTINADAALRAKVKALSAAATDVESAAASLQAAISAIAAHRARTEATNTQADIDKLKADANEAKEVVDVVIGIVSGLVFAAKGDYGDAINQVGVVAGTLLSHVNVVRGRCDRSIRAARRDSEWSCSRSGNNNVRTA